MNNFCIIFLAIALCSCNDSKITNQDIELISELTKYVEHVNQQKNTQLQKQPIFAEFLSRDTDTIVRFYTRRFVFKPIDENFCYVGKMSIHSHEVYFLDGFNEKFGTEIYGGIKSLKPLDCNLKNHTEPTPPHTEVLFNDSQWEYQIKSGRIIRK